MALADVYMLTQFQRDLVTQEVLLNNFFYKRVTAAGNAVDLIEAWENAGYMRDAWSGCQDVNIQTFLTRVISLGSLTDFAESTEASSGSSGGADRLPLHDALNFTLRLDTRAVRPGSKRLSGITEDFQTNGVVTDAGYIANLNVLVTQLSTIQIGDDDTYQPVVVKRVLRPADVDHENAYYTLPETDGELVFGNVVAALVNLKISHQNSRGNGR